MSGLFNELKRRNVFRVGIAYAVVGWLLVQVVTAIEAPLALPTWFDTGIIILVLIGFPIALIFSWAFELTPEGVKKTAEVDADASITHNTGRKIDRMIIGALVLLVGFLLVDRFTGSGPIVQEADSGDEVIATASTTSIAVLPFVNMSDDASNEYFSDGISEEILNVLAQIPGLQVTSRSSAFQFKGDDIDIPTVARQLNVANVLEGSVRKFGNRVRITAQLIDASTDKHLWSASYDRELTDVFAVQDEISAAIVAALKETMGIALVEPAPRQLLVASEAHEAYLRGRHLVVQRTRSTVEGAVEEFRNAVALEPDYALAHAELAMAYRLLDQYSTLTNAEANALARPPMERALALDPELAEVHAAMGLVTWGENALDEALVHFRRAIEINPNYAIVYSWTSNLLNDDLGDYASAIEMRERALPLDPLSSVAIGNQVNSLVRRGEIEAAQAFNEKLRTISPLRYNNRQGSFEEAKGEWAESALAQFDALLIDPTYVVSRALVSFKLAQMNLAEEALGLLDPPERFVLNWLGRPAEAVRVAEAALIRAPDDLALQRALGQALATAGNTGRARPILEDVWINGGKRVTRSGVFDEYDAFALILILKAADDDAADALIAAVMDDVSRRKEAGWNTARMDFEEGLARYLAGERQAGLALISTAVDKGHFIGPIVGYWQFLLDDPGFAPILAADEAKRRSERAKFLTVVCGDNPYAAVWQPEPGTCEDFTETASD